MNFYRCFSLHAFMYGKVRHKKGSYCRPVRPGMHKSQKPSHRGNYIWCFYVLLTVYLSISLDNDQLDVHLLYFTIHPLQSSTCFEHYMLIMRRLNCTDAAFGIILSVSGHPVHRLRVLSQAMHRTATD